MSEIKSPALKWLHIQSSPRDNRVQVMVASRAVKGSRAPGQGGVLSGTGTVQTEGEAAQRVKAAFPWARGALVIEVQSVKMHL